MPDRDSIPTAELPEYDAVIARQKSLWSGSPLNSDRYFGALLNSPPLAGAMAELGRLVRTSSRRGAFSDADREFVDMALGCEFDYWTIPLLHLPDALAVGVRLESIQALVDGEHDRLPDGDRQLLSFVLATARGTMTDELFDAVRHRFGQRGVVEYSVFIGFLTCIFRLWQCLGVPDSGRASFVGELDRHREGKGELPAPDARLG